MSWCHQAISQCWLRSILPYEVIWPQWVNACSVSTPVHKWLVLTNTSSGDALALRNASASWKQSVHFYIDIHIFTGILKKISNINDHMKSLKMNAETAHNLTVGWGLKQFIKLKGIKVQNSFIWFLAHPSLPKGLNNSYWLMLLLTMIQNFPKGSSTGLITITMI